MRYLLSLLAALFLWSNLALADCKATVFLKDSRTFQSLTSGFDWCFQTADSWGLDMSKGWKERYCSATTNYDRYGGVTGYSFTFLHRDLTYSAIYPRSIFYAMDLDYSNRIFDGFRKNIEVRFSPGCGSNGSYDDY